MSQGPYDPQQEGQGYGQPTPPPGQYGYGQSAPPPVGPHGYAPDVDTGATLAMILAIIGLVICQPLCIVSLIMSNNAARKVQETGKWQDQGQVKAAKIISIVGIVLMAIGIVIGIIYVIAIGAAISSGEFSSS